MFNGGGERAERQPTPRQQQAREDMKVIISSAKNGTAVAKTPDGKTVGKRALNWSGATPGGAVDALAETLLSKHPTIEIDAGEMPMYRQVDGAIVWSAFNEVSA